MRDEQADTIISAWYEIATSTDGPPTITIERHCLRSLIEAIDHITTPSR